MTKRSYTEFIIKYRDTPCIMRINSDMLCDIETCPLMKCNRVRERINCKKSNFVIVNKPKDIKIYMTVVDRVMSNIKNGRK